MPRKSLTEGDSPRITLRMNNEILEILENIPKNERSAYIRKAILHYASRSTYQRKTSSYTYSKDNLLQQNKEKKQSSTPVRILHKPAWQR